MENHVLYFAGLICYKVATAHSYVQLPKGSSWLGDLGNPSIEVHTG